MLRLTLRTLLAYLDDVLEPAETREIGRKIQESPRAAKLVGRIREVVRQRRLSAPDLEGPGQGVQPQVVAQYLDNTLPPDQVADIEQVCLDSDEQLAEVAACHQILTLALGDRTDIEPQRLERFYALGPVPATERLNVPGDGNSRPAPNRPNARITPAKAFESTVPEYLKDTPWSQRLGPILGIAAVLLAAIFLLSQDRELFRSVVGKRSGESVAKATPDAGTKSPDPGQVAGTNVVAPNPQPAETPLTGGTDKPAPMAVADHAGPADATAPANVIAAVSGLPLAPTPGTEPAAPQPTVDEPLPPVAVQSVANDGLLLRLEPLDMQWYVLPSRAEIHRSEVFVCPEPYEGLIDFGKGTLRATILGETRVGIVGPVDAKSLGGLEVDRGRVLVAPGPAAGDGPWPFVLAHGGRTWKLELATRETVLAVEVQPRDPTRYETVLAKDWSKAAVFVLTGEVHVLAEPAEVWNAGTTRNLSATPPAPESGVPGTFPAWVDPLKRQTTSTLRRYANAFEKEFDPNQPIGPFIPALMKDSRPKIAELAVRCLALTESYRALTQALAESPHEEARLSAAAGLRAWITRAPENGPALREELSARYPADQAEPLYRLLWAFTADEAKDHLTSLQLVEWLRSEHVAIRELAFQQLVRLTNRRYDYRPLAIPSQREPAIHRWLAHIEREGALLRSE